ncbi:MAG: outer membrane beta-barrel family protein [Ginsengibacter sp.]
MRKLNLVLISSVLLFSSYAQTNTVKGSVINADENVPVYNAVAALLNPLDSILYKFSRTDAKGDYILKNVKPGKYILMVSQPYFADIVQDVEINGDVNIPKIALLSKSKLLQEVIVNTGKAFKIKGDTTIYTADSFQVSANANVEELLKKLPGIQVDKDGKIKAMGETVQKILVDGEEFFGDDPGMAVKNLRADAVKEVQVFDKKSETAEFTGIDDGNTQKTINLKLKEEAKKGYFGKVDLSGGPQKHIDNRYNSNLMFSSFKGKRKLSAYLLNGNTGQDRLGWDDLQKYGSLGGADIQMDDDGSVMISMSRGDDGESYIDSRNGFLTNVNAGLHYSNKWNDKYSFNLTPVYTSQNYNNRTSNFTQTQIGDSVLNQNSNGTNHVNRSNIKLDGVWDLKLDSANTLKITAGTAFYKSEGENSSNSVSTGDNGTLKNTSEGRTQNNSDKQAVRASVIFKHKFKKNRRTLTFNASYNSMETNGTSYNKSFNQAYLNGLPADILDINQMKDNESSTRKLSTQIVYTEPLSKNYSLELGYKLSFDNGSNDQLTHSFSPGSGKYDELVDTLTNQFKQNIIQQVPSAKINFATKKLKINAGAGVGIASYQLEDITFAKNYDRDYVNFYPNANITYTYKSNHSIRLSYSGDTRQPQINQLQPLRNNDNYFYQYIGNPNLKPSFSNSFSINHNAYNFIKDFWMYQSMNINFVSNSIINNSIINLNTGKTITQPINTNGNFSTYMYSTIGFKIKKIDASINLSPQINYNRGVNFINNKKSYSNTWAPSMDVSLNKSKAKKYDVRISNSLGYNTNTTTQNTTKIHYYTNTLNFNGKIYIKKDWSISTTYEFYNQQKTVQSDKNISRNLWNARAERTFKDNEFTLYISVQDILNQNVAIDRYVYGNVYSESRNDRIKRYFMAGFAWNFKNKSTKK